MFKNNEHISRFAYSAIALLIVAGFYYYFFVPKNTEGMENSETYLKINPNKFLNYNYISPECCSYNPNYSTGSGCVCFTPQQINYLKNRGQYY